MNTNSLPNQEKERVRHVEKTTWDAEVSKESNSRWEEIEESYSWPKFFCEAMVEIYFFDISDLVFPCN